MKFTTGLVTVLWVVWGAKCADEPEAHDPDRFNWFKKCYPHEAKSIYEYEMQRLDGTNSSMGQYAGNVLLLINVATF